MHITAKNDNDINVTTVIAYKNTIKCLFINIQI